MKTFLTIIKFGIIIICSIAITLALLGGLAIVRAVF